MHSSISSSNNPFQRQTPNKPLIRIVLGSTIAVLLLLTTLEFNARQNGILPTRDMNMSFWQNHRFRLDDQPADTTVVFGASRFTFGLDHNTWEQNTGKRPYNLGLHGASSLPMLHDYAVNTEMNGIVLCAISGGFTFANESIPFSERIAKAVKDINKNRYSFALRSEDFTGRVLQANFAVLNPYLYSPIEVLREHLRFPPRKNERAWFHVPFTVHHTEENQDIYIDDLSDPYYMAQWDSMHQTVLTYMERYDPRDLDDAIAQMKRDISLISQRGGEVIFVRFPVSRFFKEWEDRRFPRDKYWDIIIEETGCRGFHYLDNTNTRDLFPPDGSHLMPHQAKVFTRELVKFVYPED